jgi:hypothetical protein
VGKRLLIGLVVLHVLAIAYYRRRHSERLVAAMVLGDKVLSRDQVAQTQASSDGPRERLHALGWLVACGLIVYAVVQWGMGS